MPPAAVTPATILATSARIPTGGAPSLLAPTAPDPALHPAGAWAQRAALAIQQGRPLELRRIAAEMERAGLDIEAGLLENYALLLEASQASRPRVLAEVTRMLQAATQHRWSAPASPRKPPASPASGPSARPRIPMPTFPLERRRRAAR